MVVHDVVIIGAGLAGMRAALEVARHNLNCAMVTKVHPTRSHTVAAQGGINAAIGEDDSWEAHVEDTIKGGDWLGDQDAIELMCKEGPQDIMEVDVMGCLFSRDNRGRIAQRPFGGAGFPRTCYSADRTGHVLLHTLYEQIMKSGVWIYEEWFALSLVVGDGACRGVIAMDIHTGRLHRLHSKAVILATGGYGRVYRDSTNSLINTGDGMVLALRVGTSLMDMEFVQFHPTGLKSTGILVTEGARGEGGYLINSMGERFMQRYTPKMMELASRDIVCRAEQREIDEGRGVDGCVLLDLRHLGEAKINERLPQIRQLAIDFEGVDPVKEPVPVKPVAHYSMGGVKTDCDGATNIKGLHAVGECACVSVHGANRLGGNSLLEALVFGRWGGQAAASYAIANPLPDFLDDTLKESAHEIALIMNRGNGEKASSIREELESIMTEYVGVFRDRVRLETALLRIRGLKERYQRVYVEDRGDIFNTELVEVLELGNLLTIAECITLGALNRTESRGSHYRLDFPDRDDENWLKHTMFYMDGEVIRPGYRDVVITRYKPGERGY